MTPQREEALRLMRLALRDRETFDLLFPIPASHLASLGFHAQQAAEKALKSVAVLFGIAIPRTHDLVAIGQALLDRGHALPLGLEDLRSLNPFAVEYRYDDEFIPATTREQLASLLSTVIDWAQKILTE